MSAAHATLKNHTSLSQSRKACCCPLATSLTSPRHSCCPSPRSSCHRRTVKRWDEADCAGFRMWLNRNQELFRSSLTIALKLPRWALRKRLNRCSTMRADVENAPAISNACCKVVEGSTLRLPFEPSVDGDFGAHQHNTGQPTTRQPSSENLTIILMMWIRVYAWLVPEGFLRACVLA